MPDLPDCCDGCDEPFELGDEIEWVADMQPAPGEASIIYVHHDRGEACLRRLFPTAAIRTYNAPDVRERLADEAMAFLAEH